MEFLEGEGRDSIVLLQDVRLGEEQEMENRTHEWTIKGVEKRGAVGGVAIGVPRGSEVEEVGEPERECQILKATIDGRKMVIGNTYIRPGEEVRKDWLDRIREEERKEKGAMVIMGGDFNAPCRNTGSASHTKRGERLEEEMEKRGWTNVPTDKPTFYSNSTAGTSVLDHWFINGEARKRIEKAETREDWGSDHRAIQIRWRSSALSGRMKIKVVLRWKQKELGEKSSSTKNHSQCFSY